MDYFNLAKCYAPELKSKNEICDSAQLKNNEKEFFSQQLISLRKQKLSFLQENNIELTSHQLERCLDGVNSNFIYSPIDSWNSSDTKLISKEELWRIYFNNEKFVLNFLIFQDLWKRGYFLTCGYKFGGDFMLYKEDPVICHSTYIIICKHATEEITTNDISQICRIAVSVKKIAVFATCNPKNAEKLHYQIENANFDYQSITWTESV
ncbi:hypothetical protein A3Q56_04911 [Intoshia linei]|uniref:tRNA-intron lyase n=1 Tax=Intoshia linei TaxID=1819745 RepID=A0A177AZB2_9BILA|nr:hypothetical protein A3Q56_04911 [Intoshia linei]